MKKCSFLVGLLIFGFSISLSAQNWWKNAIRGEGPNVTRDLDLPAFDAFKLSIDGDVYLTQGSPQSVRIEAQANIIDNLITEVEDQAWVIKYDRPVKRSQGIKIYITIPTLTRIAVSGSGNITSENTFTGLQDVDASVSGSGNLRLAMEAADLQATISGSGNIALKGVADNMNGRISGSGDLRAPDLKLQSCSVRISGSGNCEVEVAEDLNVNISGSGNVTYGGRPKMRSKISGSGDVRSKG